MGTTETIGKFNYKNWILKTAFPVSQINRSKYDWYTYEATIARQNPAIEAFIEDSPAYEKAIKQIQRTIMYKVHSTGPNLIKVLGAKICQVNGVCKVPKFMNEIGPPYNFFLLKALKIH